VLGRVDSDGVERLGGGRCGDGSNLHINYECVPEESFQ